MDWKVKNVMSTTFRFIACYILALDSIINCDMTVQGCTYICSNSETLEQVSKAEQIDSDFELVDPLDIVIDDEYSMN